MSPEHQEFIDAFDAEGETVKPTLAPAPKSEYEKAFSELTSDESVPGSSATLGPAPAPAPTQALPAGAGESAPADLQNSAKDAVSAVVESTAETSTAKPAAAKTAEKSAEKKQLAKSVLSSLGGNIPQVKPDRSADEYISSFNSMARADEADRAATARSTSQEAARLAGK